MNKELIFNIIDNKINKINFNNYYNFININDVHTLISAIKLNKSSNLIVSLNLSDTKCYQKDFSSILNKLFNYLVNDKKIIKLSLLLYNYINYTEYTKYLNCNKISNLSISSSNYDKYDPFINTIYKVINNNKTL